MKRNEFLKKLGLAVMVPAFSNFINSIPMQEEDSIQLLRHATLWIKMGGLKILVDPMLSDRDAMEPVQNAGNSIRIPMTDLPVSKNELNRIINETDVIIVTHIHRDHWDSKAQELIDKEKLILCQPEDIEAIQKQGFKNVSSFNDFELRGVRFQRTGGQHGTGEIGKLMGHVSGVVIQYKKKTIYIAGDTIWCDDVERVLSRFNPDYVVVNAGAAQFLQGGPITMTKEDVKNTLDGLEKGKVIAVHMDTVNHCLLKKQDLRTYLPVEISKRKLIIPEDGEVINL
jgi:L-ascorbate metabolism protein UlaG (beta-lactamase superfamily)